MWTVNRRIDAPARAELTGADELSLGTRGTVWTPFGVPLPIEITEFVPLRDAGRGGRCGNRTRRRPRGGMVGQLQTAPPAAEPTSLMYLASTPVV